MQDTQHKIFQVLRKMLVAKKVNFQDIDKNCSRYTKILASIPEEKYLLVKESRWRLHDFCVDIEVLVDGVYVILKNWNLLTVASQKL